MNTDQKKVALCMFEKEVPCQAAIHDKGYDYARDTTDECPHCNYGVNRVPLLDGVRELCRARLRPMLVLEGYDSTEAQRAVDDEAERQRQDKFHREPCRCKGLRWTPTEDAWKWLEAMSGFLGSGLAWSRRDDGWELSLTMEYPGKDIEASLVWGKTVGEAFISALFQAMLPLAVNADEVMAWVKGTP